jgi:hypothetical protein
MRTKRMISVVWIGWMLGGGWAFGQETQTASSNTAKYGTVIQLKQGTNKDGLTNTYRGKFQANLTLVFPDPASRDAEVVANVTVVRARDKDGALCRAIVTFQEKTPIRAELSLFYYNDKNGKVMQLALEGQDEAAPAAIEIPFGGPYEQEVDSWPEIKKVEDCTVAEFKKRLEARTWTIVLPFSNPGKRWTNWGPKEPLVFPLPTRKSLDPHFVPGTILELRPTVLELRAAATLLPKVDDGQWVFRLLPAIASNPSAAVLDWSVVPENSGTALVVGGRTEFKRIGSVVESPVTAPVK